MNGRDTMTRKKT